MLILIKEYVITMKKLFPIYFVTLLILGCADNASDKGERNRERQEMDMNDALDEKRTAKENDKIILFFGNSLSAGYGLEAGESFPDRIQEMIDEAGLNYLVVNAGNSGETTAGGEARIDWVLNQPIDIFVLELGGNDILRGIDVNNSEKNLRSIIEKVRAKNPEIKIVLAGMQAPPNMGDEYTRAFAEIYPRLAKEYNLTLIPFLLDKVGGVPSMNQPDGIHPNVEGAKVVAQTVWESMNSIL